MKQPAPVIQLTAGPIFLRLIHLSLPLIGASFLQTCYAIVNMAWLGRAGSHAVAAAGAAGFFTWFGMSLGFTSRVGGEVNVAHAMGEGDLPRASCVATNSLAIALAIGIVYSLLLQIFAENLVVIFGFRELDVIAGAARFLRTVSLASVCVMFVQTFSGIMNSIGDSRTPFIFSSAGLLLTAALDPLLIFGIGPFPKMGATGAAIATVCGQSLCALLAARYLIVSWRRHTGQSLFAPLSSCMLRSIVRMGLPVAIQSAGFSVFAMLLARIVTSFGAAALAVQSIGTQIESITYMTANGLATASCAFVGQNYGAHQFARIARVSGITFAISVVLGILVGGCFLLFSHQIFSIFLPDPAGNDLGAKYLRILAFSQVFMSIEIVIGGAFRGLGRTGIPSIVSIVFTGARVPAALFLTASLGFGVASVWWAVSLSSVVKGTTLAVWYYTIARRFMHNSPAGV